jgi:hypothetical protein
MLSVAARLVVADCHRSACGGSTALVVADGRRYCFACGATQRLLALGWLADAVTDEDVSEIAARLVGVDASVEIFAASCRRRVGAV